MNISHAAAATSGVHAALIASLQHGQVIETRPQILTAATPGDKLDRSIDAQNARALTDRANDRLLGALLDSARITAIEAAQPAKAFGLDAGPASLAGGRGFDRQRRDLAHAGGMFEDRLLNTRAINADIAERKFDLRA